MLITVLLGLIGLGAVVLVHELGHFAAARAVGVKVEAFSIGWGPRLFGFTRGGTEWRFSALPIGGYCKMMGEESFRKALEEKAPEIPRTPGSLYGAAPWRRIVISLAGPIANVVFALIVYIAVAAVGYSNPTSPNRIVLASEFSLDGAPSGTFPADRAGLRSGDVIVEAAGKPVADYADIQEIIALSAGKPLELRVERDGRSQSLVVVPALDRESGAGKIGVYSWTEPVVASVQEGSAAALAGFEPGDRLAAINGAPVRHVIEALSFLSSRPERVVLTVERGGTRLDFTTVLSWNDKGGSDLGLAFKAPIKTVKALSFAEAVGMGASETWKTFSVSVVGLATLFRGVDVLRAVSGPARITWLVGQSASEGIARSGIVGLAIPLSFLAFLSIGLFIMNLLPIPALDGGQTVIYAVELVRGKALSPRAIYRYQLVGAAFILAIFVLATVGDILFFASR